MQLLVAVTCTTECNTKCFKTLSKSELYIASPLDWNWTGSIINLYDERVGWVDFVGCYSITCLVSGYIEISREKVLLFVLVYFDFSCSHVPLLSQFLHIRLTRPCSQKRLPPQSFKPCVILPCSQI